MNHYSIDYYALQCALISNYIQATGRPFILYGEQKACRAIISTPHKRPIRCRRVLFFFPADLIPFTEG